MEAGVSVMKSSSGTKERPMRAIAASAASIAAVLLLLMTGASFPSKLPGTAASADQSSLHAAGYVGSRACSNCHPIIYESFLRTDMGRSMSEITPSLLEKMPTSASIFNPKLNRHFEVAARDGKLYQSEYETG